MISPEERNRKPYALPVQCLPYAGLGDDQIQSLVNKVIGRNQKEWNESGMWITLINDIADVIPIQDSQQMVSIIASVLKGNTRSTSVSDIPQRSRAKHAGRRNAKAIVVVTYDVLITYCLWNVDRTLNSEQVLSRLHKCTMLYSCAFGLVVLLLLIDHKQAITHSVW